MRITKRQLKRIIREEYSKLKRQGLITEASNISHGHKGIGEYYFDDEVGATEETIRRREAVRKRKEGQIGAQRNRVFAAANDGYSAGKSNLPRKVPQHFQNHAKAWLAGYDQGKK